MAYPVGKNKILVLSGMDGVGKGTIVTQLALAFVRAGQRVGLLDVDLTSDSVPRSVGLSKCGEVVQSSQEGFLPVYTDATRRLGVMSIWFLLQNKDDTNTWRGPKRSAMIKNFMENVIWGDIDYLIINTPPGTCDENISTIGHLAAYTVDGAVLVTTPQEAIIAATSEMLSFCKKSNIPVLGLVENMSGFYCPKCRECTFMFTKGRGEELAKQHCTSFIGRIPIDPRTVGNESPSIERFLNSRALKVLDDFALRQLTTTRTTATPIL